MDIYTHYTRATADKVSWFDLWAAAEALNAVCLWHGKEGIATSLGMLTRQEDTAIVRQRGVCACSSITADET